MMACTADSRRGQERSYVAGNRRPWGMALGGLMLMALLSSPQGSQAQGVAFAWAASMGGKSVDRGRSITVDGSGNVYITGSFEGAAKS